MSSLAKTFKSGKRQRSNPSYKKIQYRINKSNDINEIKLLCNQLRKLPSKYPMDLNFKRIYYVKYVHDFVVGFIGSRNDTLSTKKFIVTFLKNILELTLNEDKTFITNFSKNFIKFLDFFIKSP